jgi:hypothetical protein
LPACLRLPQGHCEHRVVIVGQAAFIACRSSVPAPPVVRLALGVFAFETASAVFVKHGEENLVCVGFAAQIVKRGQGKEGIAPGRATVLVVLEAGGSVSGDHSERSTILLPENSSAHAGGASLLARLLRYATRRTPLEVEADALAPV